MLNCKVVWSVWSFLFRESNGNSCPVNGKTNWNDVDYCTNTHNEWFDVGFSVRNLWIELSLGNNLWVDHVLNCSCKPSNKDKAENIWKHTDQLGNNCEFSCLSCVFDKENNVTNSLGTQNNHLSDNEWACFRNKWVDVILKNCFLVLTISIITTRELEAL